MINLQFAKRINVDNCFMKVWENIEAYGLLPNSKQTETVKYVTEKRMHPFSDSYVPYLFCDWTSALPTSTSPCSRDNTFSKHKKQISNTQIIVGHLTLLFKANQEPKDGR